MTTRHLHTVVWQRGVWACTECPAAWQRYRMIPAGSAIAIAWFRV